MSKPISSIHPLTRLLSVALLTLWLLFLALSLLPARPALAQGPDVTIGDLPPGKVVTITFRAAITDPLPAGVSQVCNQGLVAGANFSDTLTNDPATPAANDPTCTPIDLPTLSIAPGTNPNETGPTNGSFSLSLDEPAPTGGLTISYNLAGSTANRPADYSLAAGTNLGSVAGASFTLDAGATTATLVIVPVDDAIDDDGETVRLTLAASSGYIVGTATATRTITDNDTAGVTLSPATVGVTEGGATDTYTVQLDTIPTAPVTLTFNTGTQLEPLADLVIPANATALDAHTITVTATDDTAVEGTHPGAISHSAASADPNYNGVGVPFSPSATVAANITDNDIGYSLAANQATVPEGDTGSITATFTLTRTGDFTRSSSIDFTLGGAATGGVDYNNVQPGSGTVNFSAGQLTRTISLAVLGDFLDEADEDITVTLSGATGTGGGGTGAITGSPASTTILDDDTAAILVSPTTPITISEPNGADTFNIRLASQPAATVAITLTTSTVECTLSTGQANLTALNWDTGITVTITAQDDVVVDGPQPCNILTSAAGSGDPTYDGQAVADVPVTVNDDDVAGVTITSSGLNVTEGGVTDTYTVQLDTIPASPVTLTFNTGAQLEAILDLVIPANATALTPHTVTVTATDDTLVEGDHFGTISHSAASADPDYNGAGVPFSPSATVTATITDNDISYTLAANQATVPEGDTGSTGISFTVSRTGDITRSSAIDFAASGTATTGVDYNNLLPAGGTLNFSGGQAARDITLDVLGDQIVEGDEVITLTLSNGTGANGSGTGVIAGSPATSTTILDDDTAGIVVTPTSLTISEPDTTASFMLSLTSQPTASVTIGLTSGDLSECTVPALVTLTTLNWNSGVSVTVTAVDDLISDGPQPCAITTAASSGDSNYDGVDPDDVAVTVNDDDVPGFLITPTAGLTTTETGGTAAFTVRLRTAPLATVTLTLVSTDTGEGTINPASLTFSGLNWNLPQIVTLTGQNDAVDDGDQPYTIRTNPATSSDSDYDNLNPANVSAVNLDDDTAGFIISALSGDTGEDGLTATLRIRLASRPTANVTLPVTSSDPGEGTASPASLTFTPLNWNVVQTVTLTGVDDSDTDGSVTYTLQLGPSTSPDPLYNGLDPADITLENHDNDNQPLYLPLIVKNAVIAPDLVIDSLTVSSTGATLVIRNRGTAPVVDAFWVDLYFNPSAPPAVNQPWPTLASRGAVWGVSGSGLAQLAPGGTLTLTLNDAYYFPDESSPTPFPAGATVYSLVDSVDFDTSHGAILESNESNNRFGPVTATAATAGASTTSHLHPTSSGLPPRD